MWIRVPVHCQCRGHCPLRQPCHRAKVGCQSRCQCVAAVTVPRERDERCPRGLCLPVGYCASTPGYPNSGIPAGIRNQESDSGMGPTRSRFLIPVPSQPGSYDFPRRRGPRRRPGRFRGGPPAGTCCHIYAATFARFGRAILGPVHPFCSIRRFQAHGVGRAIALHTCQMLRPTVPCPYMSAVRSRRPAVSAFASEAHLRSPGGISGPAGQLARGTRASWRGSRVSMHRFARGQPSPSICSRNPERPGRCEARVAVLTERRRRCAHPAPILPYSGPAMRLGRPCVVGAGQVAPTPRIRPREVKRCGGSEAHGASKSRPSNLKLALVAYWYGPALCAGSSRHIWHIRMVNARPGARMRLRSTGRPLPAYSRRLVSLQATCSLCQAYGMHASRRQQQACV